ncbi:hypothetical protein [Pontibacter roseus]|nr:hypothetical protein [Pontibacter roseus]
MPKTQNPDFKQLGHIPSLYLSGYVHTNLYHVSAFVTLGISGIGAAENTS